MIARVTRNEFSAELFEQGRPTIITDALQDWQIAERWAPEHIARIAKARPVTMSTSHDGRYLFDASHDINRSHVFEKAEVEFGDAARRMLDENAGDHIYVMQQSIPDVLPELLDNLVVPEWIASSRPAINLWFGRRTTTQLHFDYSNNFFAQLYGSKQFVIFDPHESERLHPHHHDTATAHLSHVDALQPDLARYPDFADASPVRFTINAGELLFLPAFWWHQVQAADVAVSVNFWWHPDLRQTLGAPNAVRALPNFYAMDRLAGFKPMFLQPAGLDFLTGAQLFLSHGRIWTAGLLALAAFDEAARNRDDLRAIDRPQGCRLSALAADLQPVCAALAADANLSSADRAAIDGVPMLAAQVAEFFSDAKIDRVKVEALVAMMKSSA
ncbi:cupin-like domain-containing protein [Paraburkholderia megapolitana]|uniref:Jumonji domain-containing protein 7 n=1 Tax=Paraburkholderia megapolitana TaxID=420953 RepID=A0A1I3Q6V9_9BURK|nr:cupin-like domain-containing protein [Paraburkholderia megapolitana]SFJ29420.1 jumonji domain-containing protein 7 [Paraburkholderia megapolitana]